MSEVRLLFAQEGSGIQGRQDSISHSQLNPIIFIFQYQLKVLYPPVDTSVLPLDKASILSLYRFCL